jgi:ATP-dependent RNA helicase DeaD
MVPAVSRSRTVRLRSITSPIASDMPSRLRDASTMDTAAHNDHLPRRQDEVMRTFEEFGLSERLLAAIKDVGYEAPTPIQSRTIPLLLAGRDVIGQAQTGTGKTAAFALPILQALAVERAQVQALVLTPTRELAIQVAEAIHTYAKRMGGVRVLPVYGGQPMSRQLQRLKSGIHVVVGTPGRLLDHLRRGTLTLTALKMAVLDEADEMLRMGFIEDVESILAQLPPGHQTALFSATMPREIRRIAQRHLRDPATVEITQPTRTVLAVEQRYVNVSERQKLETLSRILESEPTDRALVFVRTKTGAAELGERLVARGYAAEALHGDLSQAQRELVLRRLRGGQTEIAVATDVAARGLDVEGISHVINYDVPHDPDAYVHRIGRTARAGRGGTAILFVTPREQRMMREIERYTGQRLTPMATPTAADVVARRTAVFKERLRATVQEGHLELYLSLVEELADEDGLDMAEVAAAAARLAYGERPLEAAGDTEAPHVMAVAEDGMVRLFIGAGRSTGVRPADIVGAIANEAGVPGEAIGAIDVHERFTFVEVPAEYKDQVLARMARATIRHRPARISVAGPSSEPLEERRPMRSRKARRKSA